VYLNPVRAGVVAKPEEYLYGSYRSYAFDRKDGIVNCDLFWGRFQKTGKNHRRSTETLWRRLLGKSLRIPLDNLYGGAILGDQTFIKQALSRLKDGIVQRREVSHRRALKAPYGSDEIIEAICSDFKVSREDVLRSGGESRNTAIYLMRRLTGMTNGQIGELFGGISYSAVANAPEILDRVSKEQALEKTDRDNQDRSVQYQGLTPAPTATPPSS